jgi:hypothetical protein
MRLTYRSALVAGTLLAFSAGSFADRRYEAPAVAFEGPAAAVAAAPAAVLLDRQDVEGVLGKEVRSSADENMGRIIDVVVDRTAQPRAAVIDFGGFLGVGSRKIAVDWSLLHFDAANDARTRITVELTADQVRSAPEYKPAKPMVITSGLFHLESSSGAATSPN